jgi:hypothetical protein
MHSIRMLRCGGTESHFSYNHSGRQSFAAVKPSGMEALAFDKTSRDGIFSLLQSVGMKIPEHGSHLKWDWIPPNCRNPFTYRNPFTIFRIRLLSYK